MYLVFDTETTGVEDDCGLLQLSIYDPIGGMHFNEFCNPGKPSIPSAIAIHGITDAQARGFQSVNELRLKLEEYMRIVSKGERPVMVAHKAEFDTRVMQHNLGLSPQSTLCTLRMARRLIDAEAIGGFSVDAVHVYLNPQCESVARLLAMRGTHDALRDCELTSEIYTGMRNIIPKETGITDLDDHVAIAKWVESPMVVKTWGFGKHKGKPLDYDWGYVKWYMNTDNVDPDIAYSIKLLQGGRRGRR